MNLTITLPVPAVQQILDSLAKLPYEQSAPLIREIERQGTEQLQAAQAAPEPDAQPALDSAK